jgi:hypothetical protein
MCRALQAGAKKLNVGLTVFGAVMSLMTPGLRLRFRLHREQARRQYLQTATALPAGSRLEERRDDGTRLTIDIGSTTRKESR